MLHNRTTKIALFALFPVLIVITVLITPRQHPTPPLFNPEATLEINDELVARYLPSTYGFPLTIAGYVVLAVRSSANSACVYNEFIMLDIQVLETRIDHEIIQKIQTVLDALGKSNVGYSIAPSSVTLESLIRWNEERNQLAIAHGCGYPARKRPSIFVGEVIE